MSEIPYMENHNWDSYGARPTNDDAYAVASGGLLDVGADPFAVRMERTSAPGVPAGQPSKRSSDAARTCESSPTPASCRSARTAWLHRPGKEPASGSAAERSLPRARGRSVA